MQESKTFLKSTWSPSSTVEYLVALGEAVICTVEPVLKDRPIGHKYVVSQDRWSLVTGSVFLKCMTFCLEYLVFQDRWSLTAGVSEDSFNCSDCIMELNSSLGHGSERSTITLLRLTSSEHFNQLTSHFLWLSATFRPYLNALFTALDCSDNDYGCLFSLCLLYAMGHNNGKYNHRKKKINK